MSTAMPPTPKVTETDILRFLAAARETIAAVPVCWLATRSLESGTNRGRSIPRRGLPGSDPWTRHFMVRRSSRKVAEMRAAPLVTLAFQHPSGQRYIALGGSGDDYRRCRGNANDVAGASSMRIFRPASRTPIWSSSRSTSTGSKSTSAAHAGAIQGPDERCCSVKAPGHGVSSPPGEHPPMPRAGEAGVADGRDTGCAGRVFRAR